MVAYKNLFRKKVFKDRVVCNADLFVKKQFLDVWVVSWVSAISYSKQRGGGGRVGDEVKKNKEKPGLALELNVALASMDGKGHSLH